MPLVSFTDSRCDYKVGTYPSHTEKNVLLM